MSIPESSSQKGLHEGHSKKAAHKGIVWFRLFHKGNPQRESMKNISQEKNTRIYAILMSLEE